MVLSRSDWRTLSIVAVLVAAAAVTHYASVGGTVVPFVVSAAALAMLASLVGRSVEALADRLSPGATGVLQSTLGNLPELFVVLFALKAKLYAVATATIVGSILASVLLILGLAFTVGGTKHGIMRFHKPAARRIALMLLLSVGALVIPALTASLHTPAAGHERALSIAVSILLLVLFGLSMPDSIRNETIEEAKTSAPVRADDAAAPGWPLWQAVTMLTIASVAAAFASEWFVDGLTPAMGTLGISDTFAGLVIVAIAGNAVENVVGIQLAYRRQSDHALAVILQSPVQIAMMVAPALVLLSPLVGASFTLVLPPLLLAALLLAVIVAVVVVFDGESNWLEGAAMVLLYGIIATAFWWG